MKQFILAVLFLSANCLTAFSQDEESFDKKKGLKDAGLYFDKENYLAALPLYLKLDELDPNIEYKYKIGICYLYKSDEPQKSIEYLEQVLDKKPKTKDLHFYLGRAYHLNYKFDEAVEYLNRALKTKTGTEKETIERLLKNCESGKKYYENPLDVKIENIGPPINTDASEYVPVISADESVMMFTYRGEKSTGGLQNEYAEPDPMGQYYEDVYMSFKLGQASWTEPERIGENINIRGHDAPIALSPTGQKLFIYKDTEDASGDIFLSELDGYDWSAPVRLDTNINTLSWEGRVSLSANEKTLYFASEKPGGLGGRDIYVSTKRDDGSWDMAVNLGPTINTPYDDDAPFIHPDGKSLYFSSQGHDNMGGYDIFLSTLQEDGTWTVPENLGYPINTTSDDRYYVVSADGERVYYSSGKPGGYGQHDIYVIYLGEYAKEHELILIKGYVTLNEKPAEAEIYAEYADNLEPYEGYFKSNSATGKFIVILPAKYNYDLSFEAEGVTPHIENVNASEISTYTEITRDIKLYSDDFVLKSEISDTISVAPELTVAVKEEKVVVEEVIEEKVVEKVVTEVKEQEVTKVPEKKPEPELTYKVQVAACKTGENYNTDHLTDLGKIESISISGIRRLTIGNFESLEEAAAFKQKVIERGTKDAFITAVENGKRKYMFDMYKKYSNVASMSDQLGLNEIIVPAK